MDKKELEAMELARSTEVIKAERLLQEREIQKEVDLLKAAKKVRLKKDGTPRAAYGTKPKPEPKEPKIKKNGEPFKPRGSSRKLIVDLLHGKEAVNALEAARDYSSEDNATKAAFGRTKNWEPVGAATVKKEAQKLIDMAKGQPQDGPNEQYSTVPAAPKRVRAIDASEAPAIMEHTGFAFTFEGGHIKIVYMNEKVTVGRFMDTQRARQHDGHVVIRNVSINLNKVLWVEGLGCG